MMKDLQAEKSKYNCGIDSNRIPKHIAIIMDGNGRWAKKKFLPSIAGHRKGVETVREIVEACGKYGVDVLTLFAFSSDNWNRPVGEVNALMDLFSRTLKREIGRLHKNGIRIKVIGDIIAFNPSIQKNIREAEALTSANEDITLVIAASYGGQWDIVQAVKKIARDVQDGRMDSNDITPSLFQNKLMTADIPPPDLLIRTSGELRMSNFMLWQCAYSEMYFSDLLWPDFGSEEFHKAIVSFSQRQRRFGKTVDQVKAGI